VEGEQVVGRGGGGFLSCSFSWRVRVRLFPGKRISVVWILENYGVSLDFYGEVTLLCEKS
jgi:hypothetical protein